MKTILKKFDLKSALVGALLAVVVTLSVAAATFTEFGLEYKVVTGRAFEDELTKIINKNVSDGWVLVSVTGPNNENFGLAVLRRNKK